MHLQKTERREITGAIIGGAAAGTLVYALLRYLNRRIRMHTVPPIIIKSVDDTPEIETESSLQDRSSLGGAATSPNAKILTNIYYVPDFGAVTGVEVQYFDADTNKEPILWGEDLDGASVEIWLQTLTPGDQEWKWVDANPNARPQIRINGTDSDLEIAMDKTFGPRLPKNHKRRKQKRKYKGNPNVNYRFGKIRIYDGSGSEVEEFESKPSADNFGDCYTLALHNERHED